MGIENNQVIFHVKAGEALDSTAKGTGHLYKAIDASSGLIANDGQNVTGLLVQNGQNGQHVAFMVSGIGKYVAGAAITVNGNLTVATSGYLTTAGSGDYSVGKTLETATSGSVHTGLFDFANEVAFDTASAHISTFETFGIVSTVDLSAGVNLSITAGGDFGAANDVLGVLQSNTNSGDTGQIRSQGFVTVRAGGVLTADQSMTFADSGWAVAANSGDLLMGVAAGASAAPNSGSTFIALLNMATPHFATNCFDVQY